MITNWNFSFTTVLPNSRRIFWSDQLFEFCPLVGVMINTLYFFRNGHCSVLVTPNYISITHYYVQGLPASFLTRVNFHLKAPFSVFFAFFYKSILQLARRILSASRSKFCFFFNNDIHYIARTAYACQPPLLCRYDMQRAQSVAKLC